MADKKRLIVPHVEELQVEFDDVKIESDSAKVTTQEDPREQEAESSKAKPRAKSPRRDHSAAFQLLVTTQLSRKKFLDKIHTSMTTRGANTLTKEELTKNDALAEELWRSFNETHQSFATLYSDVCLGSTYSSEQVYDKTYDSYFEVKDVIARALHGLNDQGDRSQARPEHSTFATVTARKLPQISLPTFSGDYSEWASFSDMFNSMITDNDTLRPVEKLHYLKQSLVGDAAKCIANVPTTDQAFPTAWALLSKRYDNRRLQITAQLDKLFKQKKVTSRSAAELNSLITRTDEALTALAHLKVPTQYWDHVLVHYILQLLDADTREAWEVQLGDSTAFPVYSKLSQFLTGQARALERVESATPVKTPAATRPTQKPSVRSYAHAASVSTLKNAPYPCDACGSDHYITACGKFHGMTVSKRRDVVHTQDLCYNCLGHHASHACRSAKRCRTCGEKHHSMVHPTDSPPARSSAPTTKVSTRPASTSAQSPAVSAPSTSSKK